MLRRHLLAAGVLALVVAMATPVGATAGFGDVSPGKFYEAPVQWMVDNDITTGTSVGCFSPDDPVTRGQAAAFLWRIEGQPAPVTAHSFTDVTASWQQDPVSWMAEEGITSGTGDGTTYSPDDTLTRGQMAALIHRAAGEPGGSPAHTFIDVTKGWQQAPVSWMAAEGITTGTDPGGTMFSPHDQVSRGQFAAFAYRWKGEPAVTVDDASRLCRGVDEFDGSLAPGWTWILQVDEGDRDGALDDDPARSSLTTNPGSLTITAGGAGPEFSFRSLMREPVADDYLIETRVSVAPSANFQQAGLQVRPDEATSPDSGDAVSIVRAACNTGGCVGDGIYMDSATDGGGGVSHSFALPAGTGDVWLRLRHEAGTFTGSYSLDGTTWVELGTHDRVFADPIYGIGAGVSGAGFTAVFDSFSETAL